MATPMISSGDRVVDLAAALRFAASFAGAIACAVSLWVIKKNILWALAALVLGGIGGFCIGLILGRVIFRAPSGQVVVVKLGPGTLAETLKANLIGACVSGLIVALLPAVLFAESANLIQLVGLGVGVGIFVGAVSGYLASRT
jgi:hypothetical protein